MVYHETESNWSYHAYASRHVFEEKGKMRSGVEFEVYKSTKVMPFLTKDRSLLQSGDNEDHINLLDHYLNYGSESDEFKSSKLGYFGNPNDMYYLTVWFNEPSEASSIDDTSWYIIEDGNFFDFEVAPLINTEDIYKGRCSIRVIPKEHEEALNDIMMLHSVNSSVESDQLGEVRHNNFFWGANIYYVGAALCVGIISAAPSVFGWVEGGIEAFYDFGYKSGVHSANAFVSGNAPKAQVNLQRIQNELIFRPNKNIIISHWHSDHVSIVWQIVGNAAYNGFWANSAWVVPQSGSISSTVVNNLVHANGGSFTVLPNVFPANNAPVMLNGNGNFLYGKTDAFNTNTPAGRHPHHHGIYSKVSFIDQTGNYLSHLMLTGDVTYYGIPCIVKNGCQYLQACHHGGNYAYSPCNQDPNVNIGSIPVPHVQPGYMKAFYSANGVTHGHPNPGIVDLHVHVGWGTYYYTYNNNTLCITYDNVINR